MKTFALKMVFLLSLTAVSVTVQAQPCAPGNAGCLDPTFGVGGKVSFSMPTPASVPQGFVTQSDGKLVAMFGMNSVFYVLRLDANGTRDASFGTDGLLTINWPVASLKLGNVYSTIYAIAIQKINGTERLLLAGRVAIPAGKNAQFLYRMDRLMLDGSPDTSFGSNGSITLSLGTPSVMAVQPLDQKILTVSAGTDEVVRLTANGALDSTFGNGGKLISPDASLVGINPNGSIIVGGYLLAGRGNKTTATAFLRRYSSNGGLDTAFGINGVATLKHNFDSFHTRTLAIDYLGNLVIGGRASLTSSTDDYGVARFTPAGVQDLTFSGDGIATAGFSNYNGSIGSAIVQSDGKIVLTGSVDISSTVKDVGVARVDYFGSLDNLFGTGGRTTFDIDGIDWASAGTAIIQQDPGCGCEKIVIPSGRDYVTTFARLTVN